MPESSTLAAVIVLAIVVIGVLAVRHFHAKKKQISYPSNGGGTRHDGNIHQK